MKRLIGSLCVAGVFVCAMVAWAEPASGVVGTLIGRGTYEPFKFKTEPASPVDFEARAKSHIDVVVQTHTYGPYVNGMPASTGCKDPSAVRRTSSCADRAIRRIIASC